jgi:hypothetical protein
MQNSCTVHKINAAIQFLIFLQKKKMKEALRKAYLLLSKAYLCIYHAKKNVLLPFIANRKHMVKIKFAVSQSLTRSEYAKMKEALSII